MEAVNALETIADRVSRGSELTAADARAILATRDIIQIGMLADEARRRRHGSATTFVRVLEVHVDAPLGALPPQTDGGELRLVGVPRDREAALAAVRAASAVCGPIPVTGFSLPDLGALAPEDGFPGFCRDLKAAGLQAVAEVPLDRLGDWVGHIASARDAGLRLLRLTNHAATAEAFVDLLLRARSLQARVGGFQAFAPLPRTMSVALPTTGYDDVKAVALARLAIDTIDSIQVDWPLYGPKLAQVALTMGADDVDGIAAVEMGTLGPRRTALEEITGNIRAASLEPVERDALFGRRH